MNESRWYLKLTVMMLAALTMVSVAVYSGGTQEGTGGSSSGQAATGGDPLLDKSEYYEITYLVQGGDPKFEQYKEENYFYQQLKKKFNFGYKLISYPGDPYERLSLMLAAGDYPDLVSTKTDKYLQAYVEADALIPLDDLIEKYGPNVASLHKDRIPYWRVMSGLDDGKIWFYTTIEPDMSYGVSTAINEWKIRSDILEQQGYPEIRSEEDVFRVVKQGLIDNPTTNGQRTVGFGTPLRDPNSIECACYFINSGRLSHMTYKNGSVFDISKDVFIDPVKDEDFKAGLQFYNKMWREGLVDKDVLTYSSSEFQAKMATGYGLATYFYGWNWATWNQQLAAAGKDYRYVAIPGIFSTTREKDGMKVYPITNGEIWSSQSITTNAKYPERLMDVINWGMSEEGLIAAGWGEEGVQYIIGSDGRLAPTEEHMRKVQSDPDYTYTWTGQSFLGLFSGLDKNAQNYRMTKDIEYAKAQVDPKVYEVYSHYGWADVYESHNKNQNFEADFAYPAGFSMVIPQYTDEQLKTAERIEVQIHDYTIKLITAESVAEFEKIYSELIKKRDELGLPELIDLRNQRYRELMAKVK